VMFAARIVLDTGTSPMIVRVDQYPPGRNQPFFVKRVPISYESARCIPSQANDNLVPVSHHASRGIYGGGRCLVLHAWSRSASAAAQCSGGPHSLIAPGHLLKRTGASKMSAVMIGLGRLQLGQGVSCSHSQQTKAADRVDGTVWVDAVEELGETHAAFSQDIVSTPVNCVKSTPIR
jgi:hypothetical protein